MAAASAMATKQIPGIGPVGALGFGCMGFSAFYASAKTCSEEQAMAVFKQAYDAGVTLFNTADFYGRGLHSLTAELNLRTFGRHRSLQSST